MTDSEKAALRSIQDDLFKARAELNFERRCIDSGMRILRGSVEIICSKHDDHEKVSRFAHLIDAATKEFEKRIEDEE